MMEKNDITPESTVNEALPDYNRRYTYADYLTWDDDQRWELIDGVAYLMSAPNRQHQGISINLVLLFGTFLKNKTCKLYHAPFDVRLNADTLDDTVVQPDIVVICDHSKLDKAGCKGAPDLAVEILSPSTAGYDRTLKFNTYLKAGIREYWILDPETRTLAVHLLEEGEYITRAYLDNEIVPVHVLDGLSINLSEVFEEQENDMTPESEVREAVPDYNRRYTYADYLTWDDDQRWELIDGVPYLMSAPNRMHQKTLGHLFARLYNFLVGKTCEVYVAPFDVRLNADTLDDTVVQPDIVVICDHSKLDKAGGKGAPDLAVEILSPSTSHYDRTHKFNAYLKAGIREYWIINPETKTLAVNLLGEGEYITRAYSENEVAPVHVLDGFSINLSEIFEE